MGLKLIRSLRCGSCRIGWAHFLWKESVALDLPVICQVSVPPSGAQYLLAWFQSGSHFGQELLYPFSIAHRFSWLICFRRQRIHRKMQARLSRAVAQDLSKRLLDRCGLVESQRDYKASKLDEMEVTNRLCSLLLHQSISALSRQPNGRSISKS